jgi:hypothetical protein
MIVSCGYSYNKMSKVYGIATIYTTYVGDMKFQSVDPLLESYRN